MAGAFRTSLYSAGMLLCSASWLSVAHAQDQATPTGQDSASLEDIVVTAQRRSESMQRVPISIQAFSASSLAAASIRSIDDLAVSTPGLTVTRSAGGIAPFIRGVGTAAAAAGTESAVATYVDGVYHQSNYTNHLSFSDIERVEVLKGPQGTLFGRNTTGGLINIITKDPSHDFGGNVSIGYGNYEIVEGKAYLTGGLTDNLAASVSGYILQQGRGFIENVFLGTRSSVREEVSGHAKLQYVSGATKVTLAGDYSDLHDTRGFVRGIPQGSIAGSPAAAPSSWTRYIGFRQVEANTDPKHKGRDWGLSATIEHSFDAFDAISISAWRDSFTEIGTFEEPFDNDYTRNVLVRSHIVFIDRNFTQEVRLSSNTSGRFSWLVGGFYLNGTSIADLEVPTLLRGRLRTQSYSAFAEGSLKFFGDTGKLTVGGRYTVDERHVSGTVAGFARPVAPVSPDARFSEPTYRIVYDQRINSDIMAYLSYNHGFKSGNFNLVPVGTPSFRPEEIDAFEAGLKSTLLDGRLRFNLAAFHYRYKNLQLNVQSNVATTIINAASAKIDGAEFEINAKVTRNLGLDVSASYVDARYGSFPSAQVYVVNRDMSGNLIAGTTSISFDASGRQLVRAPKFSGTAGISYTNNLGDGAITANLRGQYTSGFPWEASGRLRQKAYATLNASLGYEAKAGWGVKFEATNITDAQYSVFTGSSTPGDYYMPSDPTLYQFVLSYKF